MTKLSVWALATWVALGVMADAEASAIGVVVKDNAHARNSHLYLDCNQGNSCIASATAPSTFSDHADMVANVVRTTATLQPGVRDLAIISAVGSDDNLINWLLANGAANGVRALVSTLGGGAGSCSPRYSTELAAQNIAIFWSSGNLGYNGFARGAWGQIKQETNCGLQGVFDVALSGNSSFNFNGDACSNKGVNCTVYPLWGSSNFSTAVKYSVDIANLHSGPLGTSFSAPALAGAFAGLFRRNPAMTVAEADQRLHAQSMYRDFTVNTCAQAGNCGPHFGQTYSFRELNRNLISQAIAAVPVTCSNPVQGSLPPSTAWFTDPGRSHTGIQMIARGNQIAALWMTYLASPDGRPVWYYFFNEGRDACGEYPASIVRFSRDASGATTPAVVGSARFRFASNGLANFQYTIAGQSRETTLQTASFAGSGWSSLNMTGWWSDSTRTNTGFYVQSEGTTHIAVAYHYDTQGNPVWSFGHGQDNGWQATLPMGFLNGPGRCPTCNGAPGPLTYELVGDLTFMPGINTLTVNGQLSTATSPPPSVFWPYPWVLFNAL